MFTEAVGNVRELAQALERDHKNVHGDVAILEAAGLLNAMAAS